MVLKHTIKFRNWRNYHYRKKKSFLKKRIIIQDWIYNTVEGKFFVNASLSPVIYQKTKLNYLESSIQSKNKTKKNFNQNTQKIEKQNETLNQCSVNSDVELVQSNQFQYSNTILSLLTNESKKVKTELISETDNFNENLKLETNEKKNEIQNNNQPQQLLKTILLENNTISQQSRRGNREYKLLPRDIDYCIYMIETYGDNYEAMSKDSRNIYLDDSKSISRKIRIFCESLYYKEYLNNKKKTII